MIPVNTPLLDGRELEYLEDCISTGWVSSEGSYVTRFEEEVAEFSNRSHGVAVSSGTAALQLAIEALQLPPGSEVIIPSFSIISCAACIVRVGLIPVPVDCSLQTFNVEADKVERAITNRTSAIMVVHTYGLPVDLDPILQLAEIHGLAIIEDAAEAIGQSYKGRPCGSFGDASILSFYPNKHITTGEGGMVLTSSDQLADRCRLLRNLAFEGKRRFVHYELGWNFRMSNLQAAVGCAQLENIDRNLKLKRQIGKLYNEHLRDLNRIMLPKPGFGSELNVYWVFTIVLEANIDATAEDVMRRLREKGIGTRPMFWPIHRQPVFLEMYPEFEGMSLPNSEFLAEKGLYLPSGLGLDLAIIPEICEKVRDVIEEF